MRDFVYSSPKSGVERYLSPESGSSATITFPLFSGRFARRVAAYRAAPEEIPVSRPWVCAIAFSGAGHTDNAVDIALIDFQIDVLQGFHPVFPRLEGFGHIFNLYDRLFHFLKPFRFSFCLSVTCGQMFSNQYCRNAAILPPVKGCRQNPAGFPDSRASFIIPHFF